MSGLYTVRKDSENGCSVQGCHKASRYLVAIYGNERPLCKVHARMSSVSFFKSEATSEIVDATNVDFELI